MVPTLFNRLYVIMNAYAELDVDADRYIVDIVPRCTSLRRVKQCGKLTQVRGSLSEDTSAALCDI